LLELCVPLGEVCQTLIALESEFFTRNISHVKLSLLPYVHKVLSIILAESLQIIEWRSTGTRGKKKNKKRSFGSQHIV